MPELPEVEFARRCLERWFEGRRVVRAIPTPTRTFRNAEPKRFAKLKGRLERAERKGKYLLLTFEGNQGVLAHLGMTGKFVRRPARTKEPYSRAHFALDDGQEIHFRDPRLFGRIEPVPAEALWSLPVIQELGIDPVRDGLTPKTLKAAVAPSKQPLKVALMDQARIAGLGNIHAAEALYRARLHPARPPQSLSDAEWRTLCRAIHATLKFGLADQQGEEEIEYVEEPGSENPFFIYGRAGERCRRCNREIRSFVQAGRTTHFCPGCQPQRPRKP